MRMYPFFSIPILLTTSITVAHAQVSPSGWLEGLSIHSLNGATPRQDASSQENEGSLAAPILVGASLGILGFFAGGLGAAYATDCSGEWCKLEPAFYGAAAAGTLGLALGVHLGNRRRGNFALDFLTGAAIWGAGIGIAAASEWDETVTLIAFVAVPLAQLTSTVAVERAVGRSRARRGRLTLAVMPQGTAGAAFRGSVSF